MTPERTGPRQIIAVSSLSVSRFELTISIAERGDGGDHERPRVPRRVRRGVRVGFDAERFRQAEEPRDRGAGDIGIEDPDAIVLAAQADGEQRRRQRFPDAALPGHDRDHVLEAARALRRRRGRGAWGAGPRS